MPESKDHHNIYIVFVLFVAFFWLSNSGDKIGKAGCDFFSRFFECEVSEAKYHRTNASCKDQPVSAYGKDLPDNHLMGVFGCLHFNFDQRFSILNKEQEASDIFSPVNLMLFLFPFHDFW